MYKRARKLLLNYLPLVARASLMKNIPLLYPLLEIKPTSCTAMITDRCNLKCVMCGQWRKEHGKELSTEDWKSIIGDLRKNGIRNIHFTGGEPLLRADLPELIAYCVKNNIVAGMTTNGVLLKKETLDKLIRLGLRSIVISIDALGDNYGKVRGVSGLFPGVRESAIMIAEARKRAGIDASINFTLMKDNIKDFESVKSFADEIGLPVAICLLDDVPSIFGVEENRRGFWITSSDDFAALDALSAKLMKDKTKRPGSLLLNFQGIDYIKKYFRDPLQKRIPCAISQDRIIIDPYGNLMGGCLAMGTFGNVKETPFKQLRNKEKYKEAKRKMFYKICAGCSCGYMFNLRSIPGLVVKDLLRSIRYKAENYICRKKN